VPVNVNRTTRQDWDALRAKVKGGIRNATLMAVAPTASIGLVAGTTPGFDPQFSQIFSRATSSGKFLEVNRNLVKDLQDLGLWESVKDELLAVQGDLSQLDSVPDHLKEVYKTSFQLSPYAFIEVAARAQKWIDQAISRNIYLEDRDVDNMMSLYAAAWERGVKTTYYLHMKPRHTAEQSTVRVNKTEKINSTGSASGRPAAGNAPASGGKRGFGGFGGAKKGFGAATGAASADAVVEAVSASDEVVDGAAVSLAEAPAVTGAITAAPASVLSAVATKAFAPAPTVKPAVPPVALPEPAPEPEPAVAEAAAVETTATSAQAPESAPAMPEGATALEVLGNAVSLGDDTELVGGVACPVDPMERLQCESCQ
jgi:ribonucleoside-diphosphate reductase alpha chain